MVDLSILMSLYIKEKPEYVEECFRSLLKQTVQANEWIIVEDGPLSSEMYTLLAQYQMNYPGLITRIPRMKNRGLGLALRSGVLACRNELIARMDTDDIAREDRFEKQMKMFELDPDLDICGSHIIEFDGTINNIISKRKVPLKHDDIMKYQKTRSAFNHMTVMYKKSAVLSAGNYEHCLLMEDDMLWIRMLLNGAKTANIDDFLVYARAGAALIERRGGWTYYKKYRDGKRKMLKTGFINKIDYYKAIASQLIISLLPKSLRLFIFKNMLRDK